MAKYKGELLDDNSLDDIPEKSSPLRSMIGIIRLSLVGYYFVKYNPFGAYSRETDLWMLVFLILPLIYLAVKGSNDLYITRIKLSKTLEWIYLRVLLSITFLFVILNIKFNIGSIALFFNFNDFESILIICGLLTLIVVDMKKYFQNRL